MRVHIQELEQDTKQQVLRARVKAKELLGEGWRATSQGKSFSGLSINKFMY